MTAHQKAIPAAFGRKAKFLGSSMLTALLLAGATAARAQDTAPSAPATGQVAAPVGDIIVTGSRVAAAGFNAPTPVTVVSGAALEKFQANNVADLIDRLPSVKATFNNASTGFRTQLPGANFVDLYGLGANRTLVLINGYRVMPQAPAAAAGSTLAVDLNMIPALMIDRVDVVTGGASAQWGSDAVAGVVNVVLKQKFSGIQVKAQSGISQEGDNANYRAGAMAGTNFADGRGNIIVGVDWAKNKGMGDVYSRDWSSKLITNLTNAGGTPAIVIDGPVLAKATAGGVIFGANNFAFNNYQILDNGTLAPFTVGRLGSAASASAMIGGGPNAYAFIKNNNLINPYERVNSYARAEYEIAPALTVFAEGLYGVIRASNIVNPPRSLGQVVSITNAYLPAQIRAAMQAASITSITLNRMNYDLTGDGNLANGVAEGRMKTTRLLGGLKGDLGGGWSWDAHYSWGESNYRNRTRNNLNKAKFAFSVDSTLVNGVPVCRATQAGAAFNSAAAGCVPVNLFGGVGSPSLAAAQYYLNTVDQFSVYRQRDAAANLRGQPFNTWAGPVSVALGAEYRRETHVVTVDPVSDAGGYLLNNATNMDGGFNVKEGYFEAVVPLAKDLSFARSFDVDAAVRYADYSSSGGATTWKVGVNYEPVEGLRFRATRSRDIRAPAIFELISKGSVNQQNVAVRGNTVNIPTNTQVGNPNLKPERGDTITAGLVLQPAFTPGLRLSVDYYRVKLTDAILSINSVTAGALCTAGNATFCNYFTFSATNPNIATSLTTPVSNIGFVNMNGINAVLSYKTGLGKVPGALSFDFDATYVRHVYVNVGLGAATIDRAGENGSNNNFAQPRAKFTASTTYSVGPVDLTARMDFIAKGTIDNTYNTSPTTTVTTNHVPAIAYFGLFGSLNVSKNMQVFGSIQNLLDKDPPIDPNGTLYFQTNPQYYDLIGRRFQFGVTVKY